MFSKSSLSETQCSNVLDRNTAADQVKQEPWLSESRAIFNASEGLDSDSVVQICSAHHTTCAGLTRWRLNRVIAYVGTNLSRQITLASMARSAGLPRQSFAAQFKAIIGLTPHEYVVRKRIECAQLILIKTDLMLSDVILGVGFKSRSQFAFAFKRIVGRPPEQWRRESRA